MFPLLFGMRTLYSHRCSFLSSFFSQYGLFYLLTAAVLMHLSTLNNARTHTLGTIPLDEWSVRRRDLYLTTYKTHNRQTSMLPVGFEATIPANERLKTKALNCAFSGIGLLISQIRKSINLLKPSGYETHQQVLHSTTVRSAHTVFMCFVFIWEQTATCATYSINWLVFITQMKSVYCEVRIGSLNKAVCASYLKS